MNIKVSAGIALLSAAAAAQAGSVDSSAMTTFQSGTPAVAAQVNGNFTAVTTAVDGNAADITALQSAVATLQMQMASVPAAVTSVSDLVGRTYCMIQSHSAGRYTGTNYASVNSATESYTLTITSETQLSLTGVSSDEWELGLGLADYDNGSGMVAGLQGALDTFTDEIGTGVITGTINSLSNGTLSVSVDGGAVEFYVSKYGDVIIGREFTDDSSQDPAAMWNTSTVMVECQ